MKTLYIRHANTNQSFSKNYEAILEFFCPLDKNFITWLAQAIENSPNLKHLCLENTKLNDIEASIILEVLKKSTAIQHLTIVGNHMLNKSVLNLAELLETNPHIETLQLANNNLTPEDAQTLAKALEKNKKLTSLNLHGNFITDTGVEAILTALENHPVLTKLDLSTTYMHTQGMRAIGEFLKTTTRLQTLDLSCNHITDEAIIFLVEALGTNTTLTSLNLQDNSFTEDALRLLGTALANKPLQSLNLENCQLTDNQLATLVHYLNANGKRVITLHVGDNPLTDNGYQILIDNPQISIADYSIHTKLEEIKSRSCCFTLRLLEQPKAPIITPRTTAPVQETMGSVNSSTSRPKTD